MVNHLVIKVTVVHFCPDIYNKKESARCRYTLIIA